MWSTVALISFLIGFAVTREQKIYDSSIPTKIIGGNRIFTMNTETETGGSDEISNEAISRSKSNRIFDFVKSNSNYRDNVMVLSPPLKVTLNKSPQKNDSLFRISRRIKKHPSNSEELEFKSGRRLDILRASFDPLDSVIVMSPPLRVTLNNSPQKNDSLFRISRKEEVPDIVHEKFNFQKRGFTENRNQGDNATENTFHASSSEYEGRHSGARRKRETINEISNNFTNYMNSNHRYDPSSKYDSYESGRYYSDSENNSSSLTHALPIATSSSSRYSHARWPRDFFSYLLIPVMLFLGYAPLALWALKMLVYKGLILSKLAFVAAIYTGLRTLVFETPITAVKYYNYGYENDRLNGLTDPSWSAT